MPVAPNTPLSHTGHFGWLTAPWDPVPPCRESRYLHLASALSHLCPDPTTQPASAQGQRCVDQACLSPWPPASSKLSLGRVVHLLARGPIWAEMRESAARSPVVGRLQVPTVAGDLALTELCELPDSRSGLTGRGILRRKRGQPTAGICQVQAGGARSTCPHLPASVLGLAPGMAREEAPESRVSGLSQNHPHDLGPSNPVGLRPQCCFAQTGLVMFSFQQGKPALRPPCFLRRGSARCPGSDRTGEREVVLMDGPRMSRGVRGPL